MVESSLYHSGSNTKDDNTKDNNDQVMVSNLLDNSGAIAIDDNAEVNRKRKKKAKEH